MSTLGHRSAHAAFWNSGGNAVRMMLQFAIGVLLARLLGPEAFGTMAIALLMIGFGQLIADFGLSAALIQTHELQEGDADFLFTIQLAFGGALTLLCMSLAGSIASFFGAADAASVVRWMALMFLLRALGQTSIALLSRDLRFRAIQLGAVTSYLAGYLCLGLPLALAGYGVWSLVAAQLAQSAAVSLLALIQARYLPRFRLKGGRRELLHFGRQVIFANLGSWTLSNVDSLIVGRVAGPVPLGLYNRAINLAGMPMSAIVTGLQGVLFAAVSRAQNNHEKVRKAVLACIALYLLTAGSVLLSIAATAETVMTAIYGERWIAAIPLLTPLAIAMAVNGVLAFFGPALMGLGRVDRENRAQWIAAAATVPALIAASQISMTTIAWAVLGCNLLRLILLGASLHQLVRFRGREVATSAMGATLVALAAAACAYFADRLAGGARLEWQLIFAIAGGSIGLLAGLAALWRVLRAGPLGELLSTTRMLPRFLEQKPSA